MRVALVFIASLLTAAGAYAADPLFGVLDFTLGTSYVRLERDLDFHDINAALAQLKAGKADLGRRGYGCMKRDDAYADVGCVSHTETLEGIATREIRMHFLQGRLQQFSVTAEVRHYDALVAYLRARYGAPLSVPAASAGDEASLKWQSEAAQVVAYRGKDLVFVNFELASYADAVKRKRDGASMQCG
jgi:hypothetical protein